MSTLLVLQHRDVGRVAAKWDEHHHRLAGAAAQVAEAPVGGLTPGVVGAAMMFRFRWAEHVGDLGRDCEGRADGLRDVVRDFLASDEAAALDAMTLEHLLTEQR